MIDVAILKADPEDNKPFDFKKELNKVYELSKSIESLQGEPGTEGMITRISVSIADIFIKLVLNIKSSMMGILKDLRRSELQSYIEAHRLAYTVITKSDYTKFSNVEVAIFPFNEEKIKTVTTVNSYIKSINFKNRVIEMNKILLEIYSSILNENDDALKSHTKKLSTVADVQLANNIFNMIKRNENVQLEKTTRFGKMFTSMNDFNEYISQVMNSSNALNECVSSVTIIENKLYPLMDKIVECFIKDPDLFKSFKNPGDLSSVIYDIAYFLDSAGHLFKFYNHMEHNITNILKVLKENM